MIVIIDAIILEAWNGSIGKNDVSLKRRNRFVGRERFKSPTYNKPKKLN